MDLDAELLARLRFAFVTAMLGLAMGTGALAMMLEAMWLATRRLVFRDLYRFWIRIFGAAFALGLFAGLISPHAGALLDRGMVAGFALQAGGLGVTLAGWRGIGARLHFTATSIAATGAFLAAFCVLPAYGWFQDIAPGAVLPPSFAARFVHLTLASFLATALLLGAISARTLLADPLRPAARMGLRMAVGVFAIVAPLQVIAGQNFREMVLRNRGGHFWDSESLTSVSGGAFWVMAILGLTMGALCIWSVALAARRRLEASRAYLRVMVAMGPAGFVTLAAGLVAVLPEAGAEAAASESLAANATPAEMGRLVLLVVYLAAIGLGAIQILRLAGQGQIEDGRAPGGGETANVFATPLEEDASLLPVRIVRFTALLVACAMTAAAVAYAIRGVLV